MSTEDRLRDALHSEASRIEPHEGWNAIASRLDEPAPRSRRLPVLAAVAAAVVVIAAGALAVRDNDKPRPVVTNPGTTATTEVPTTTAEQPRAWKYVWPLAYAADYATPDALATGFGREFLGVADATAGAYRPESPNPDVGDIDVVSSFGNVISTLHVVKDPDTSWHAFEATNEHLVIGNPFKGLTITSPQKITGSSVAFEGVVHVSLYGYDGGDAKHPLLATSTFTGPGTEMGPYETTITWPPTTDKWGLLMLWTDSARDGSLAEATVRLYRLT